MSVNVGEFFVNLGVKGSEKTVGAISGVKKGLGELGSLSLEAKAGLIGAFYAMEQLFAASGRTGTHLTNFNALLGVSTQTLQQYQYAARQVGVSNEAVEGTFKSLQGAVTKTLLGEGAPKGLARVSLLTGGIQGEDLLSYQEHPELLLQKLQDYASKEKNVGLRNETLKSFGLSEDIISALSRNAFRPSVLGKAPAYSEGQLKSLDRANVAWSNLSQTIQMAVGKFNAQYGPFLVNGISNLVKEIIPLTQELIKLFNTLGGFKGIAAGVHEVSDSIHELTGAVKELKEYTPEHLSEVPEKAVKSEIYLVDAYRKKFFNKVGKVAEWISPKWLVNPHKLFPKVNGPERNPLETILPQVNRGPASVSSQNIEVNQTLNFQHDGKDHHKTSDSVKKAVRDSYRQMSAQGQAT